MSTDAPDWKSLGDLLVTRRVQLHPQYKNRRKFVADTNSGGSESSWYRLITSIETGNRDNYSRETYAAMEVAYQLKPGSLTRALRTGVLEPREAAEPDTTEATTARDERLVIESIRATAEAQAKTIGEVLVERGLATPAELTVSEHKRFDEIVDDILGSNLPDETKDIILMDYVKERRRTFEQEAQQAAAISERNREAL